LTTTIFFTADVYSWRAPRCIIRLLRIIRAAARVNFAVTAAGPRIKQERDPTRRGRLTHEEASPKAQRSAYIKRTLHLSLSLSLSLSIYLSFYDPRKPLANRQIIRPNGFIIVHPKREIFAEAVQSSSKPNPFLWRFAGRRPRLRYSRSPSLPRDIARLSNGRFISPVTG